MLSSTLFWDDITKFWDENLLLFTFLTSKLRNICYGPIRTKKFVYLNIITNFRPKLTSENITQQQHEKVLRDVNVDITFLYQRTAEIIWDMFFFKFCPSYVIDKTIGS